MSLNEARQDAENRCLSCAYLVASGVRAPTWRSRVRCFLACVGQRTHARKPVGGPLDPRGRAGGRAGGRAKQSKGAGSGASDRPLPGSSFHGLTAADFAQHVKRQPTPAMLAQRAVAREGLSVQAGSIRWAKER